MSCYKISIDKEMSGVVKSHEQKQMFRKRKSKTVFHLNVSSHSALCTTEALNDYLVLDE